MMNNFALPSRSLCLPLVLLTAVSSASAQIRTEDDKFTPNSMTSASSLGEAVALSGNRILGAVRGRRDQFSGYPNSPNAGRAILLDATTGQQLAILRASDGTPSNFFSSSVAADGSLGLIGAAMANGAQTQSGAAYVFDLQSSQELTKLTASDGQNGDNFGIHAAISGTQALVGAWLDDDNGLDSGSAYLFDAVTGQQQFKLKPVAGFSNEHFGFRVALDGSNALVATGTAFTQGAVYLFDSNTGQELMKLTSPNPQSGERFGRSVAIHGSTILVGAPTSQFSSCPAGTCLGSVYLFDAVNGQLTGILKPTAQSVAHGFGSDLAVDNGHVAVSAPGASTSGYNNGSVYVFDIASGQQIVELIEADAPVVDPTDPFAFGTNSFAYGISFDAGRVAVGAPWDRDNGLGAGAIYVFDAGTVNTGQGSCYENSSNPACPCGQPSTGSAGCTNSTQVGAILYGDGDAVIGNDSLTLNVTYVPASVPGVFFQGSAQAPAILGDGMLCSNPSLRYGVQVAGVDGTVSRTGFSANAAAGSVLTYQFWYRDAASTSGSSFNFTNAWTVNW